MKMTREEAIKQVNSAYVGTAKEHFHLMLINKIYNDFEAQLKAKDKEIERLKAKIHCLENDSIVLNMEQRLIDIALVLDGKLTSKDNK